MLQKTLKSLLPPRLKSPLVRCYQFFKIANAKFYVRAFLAMASALGRSAPYADI
jgi:hypothetical protein